MRYFSSPYKRDQQLLGLLDVVVSAAIVLGALRLYPYPFPVAFAVVWTALIAPTIFVAGAFELLGSASTGRLATRVAAAVGSVALLSYPFLVGFDRPRVVLTCAAGAINAAALVALHRWFARHRGEQPERHAAFVVSSQAARARLAGMAENVRQHYRTQVTLVLEKCDPDNAEKIDEILAESPEVVVVEYGPHLDQASAERLLRAGVTGTKVLDFADFYGAMTGRLPLDLVDHVWLLRQGLRPAGTDQRRLRRVFDVVLASTLLLLALPLMALVALAVLVDSGRPVLFRQERLGLFRRPFTLVKFRTMILEAERDGPTWAQRDDPRVTRIGRMLRRTRLDEMPQLWNVVRGDARLIGPRPIREHFADRLAASNPCYDLRFLYPPGLTGWPQVLGPYGRTEDEHAVKLEMDLYYLRSASLLDDVYVLLKTVQVVLRGRGT